MVKRVKFSKSRFWFVFVMLFICGFMTGVGIANWNHAVRAKKVVEQQPIEQTCQAIEKVLLSRLRNDDADCIAVKDDLDILRKLATYGCDENREKYKQEIDNKNAILDVACDGVFSGYNDVPEKSCRIIEESLQEKLGDNYPQMRADERIERAKIYAVMAERGCPEHSAEYVEAAKKELEIARGISDDKLGERETIEVVETYKRLKMQQDAEEIFNKAKKLTNPAIDFIMQVEKIINE